jgi:hypothetical protein
MSLKGFHIVFVTVSTLLFVFLALWAFWYVEETSMGTKAVGAIGVVFATVMPIYGVCFYKKASKILV